MAKAFRVESKDGEGNVKIVIVKKPKHSQLTEAQFYSSSIFNQAKDAGVCLRSKLDEYMRKEGLWTDAQHKRAEELTKSLEKNLRAIKTGKNADGTKVKLSEGRKIALDIKRERLELNLMLAQRRQY